MKSSVKRMIALVLCFITLMSSTTFVQAAPKEETTLSNVTFDMDYYYNTYPDLQAAIGYDYNGLYNHYIKHGLIEGRSGSAEFNGKNYLLNYPDLRIAFGNDYVAYCKHFELYGKAEGRNALTLINPEQGVTAENVIGTYFTIYDPTIERATNVALAAERINGLVILPGGSFSFNQSVLPRTAENGYVMGEVIIGGKLVPGIGGGICQVSSTLYAAMVSAGLPATERHRHSIPLDYIPRELDATISGNVKDLKFVNVFDYPIQIKATADNGILKVSITR